MTVSWFTKTPKDKSTVGSQRSTAKPLKLRFCLSCGLSTANCGLVLVYIVIGSFLGDDHVVGMAFLVTRVGDLHEPAVGLQVGDGRRSAVAHAGPQAPHQLENQVGQLPAVWHTGLDALGHQFL